MIDISLIHTIGKVTTTVIMLLAFFLWTVDSRIRLSNRIFACFLLLVAFDLTGLFIYQWLVAHPVIDALRRASSFLQMPLFYFYVYSVCFGDYKLKVKQLIHAIPFLFYFVLLLTLVWVTDFSHLDSLLKYYTGLSITVNLIGELQYFFYIALAFLTLKKYKSLFNQQFAAFNQTAYRWLLQMTVVSLVAHLFAIVKDVLVFVANDSTILSAHLLVSITSLTVISWFVLKALYQPDITRGIVSDSEPLSQKTEASVVVSGTEETDKVNQLKHFMDTEQPYLNPDLTIEKLAQMIQMPTKELSALINVHMSQHFFKLVNSYRIRHAEDMLKNPKNKDKSVLEILYHVGFNSKSSFNTYFKQSTGKTPTAFRKAFMDGV